ncbi:MAG: efflux RND transporter periplasmic adaptor subunit [Gemmatimonadetes bacterium]|nr:efflux RND transporter periplasmic adaptor subunit [Gemmatimonadota bacterium]
MRRPIRKLDLLLLALGFTALACSEEIETDPEMTLARADLKSLTSETAARGADAAYRTFLYSERDVDVFSRLGSGDFFEQGVIVQAIHAEVGDRVARGELLATLEDEEARIERDAAKAAADEAAATFARVEQLRERDLVSPSEYDEALYAKRFAEAELARAELNLSRTRVRAPFAGVVSRRYVRVGELIEGSTPLFRVTAMTPLRARLLVPEDDAGSFHVGAPVQLTDANGATATARVLVVGPTVDPGSGTREVLVELKEPDGFRPGATVLIEPLTDEAAETR